MNRRPSSFTASAAFAVATLAATLLAACAGPRVQRMPQAPRTLARLLLRRNRAGSVRNESLARSSVLPLPTWWCGATTTSSAKTTATPVTVEPAGTTCGAAPSSASMRVATRCAASVRLPELTLNVSDAELELAFALVREEPQLATVLSQPQLNFYGGFLRGGRRSGLRRGLALHPRHHFGGRWPARGGPQHRRPGHAGSFTPPPEAGGKLIVRAAATGGRHRPLIVTGNFDEDGVAWIVVSGLMLGVGAPAWAAILTAACPAARCSNCRPTAIPFGSCAGSRPPPARAHAARDWSCATSGYKGIQG